MSDWWTPSDGTEDARESVVSEALESGRLAYRQWRVENGLETDHIALWLDEATEGQS